MEHLYTQTDREPLSDSYVRLTYWEDPGLYELSIIFSGAASQCPDRKLAKITLLPKDAEKLAFAIESHIEDTIRKEAGL